MALNVEYQWIDSHTGLPVDNVTAVEIGIQIDGVSVAVTDDIRTRTTRETISVSGYRLASWMVDNRWRLRYETDHDTIVWHEVQRERADSQERAWRRMEAMLGFDPDAAEPDQVDSLNLCCVLPLSF